MQLDDPTILKNVSVNIRRALEDRNLSRRQLAALCGEHAVVISGIARGENMPGVGRLARIAAALQTSIDYLIADHSEEKFIGQPPRKRGNSLAAAG